MRKEHGANEYPSTWGKRISQSKIGGVGESPPRLDGPSLELVNWYFILAISYEGPQCPR